MTASLQCPRIIISGVNSKAGKTLLSLAITLALKKRKIKVACCLSSNSFYNSVLFKQISDRYVHVLDQSILPVAEILNHFSDAARGSEFVLIDGKDGLYDGISPGLLHGSDSFLASLTNTPVVLVANVKNFGSSISALVKGYREAAGTLEFGGVIANYISETDGPQPIRDKIFYNAAMHTFGNDPLIGAFPFLEENSYKSNEFDNQHLQPPYYSRQFLYNLADIAERSIDLDSIIRIAEKADKINIPNPREHIKRRTRIAVTDDNAFCIGFQDNLDLLTQMGADLVKFSPLIEDEVPKNVGAIYITGCFLKEYAKELAENESIKNSILNFANNGGAIYSEGAGTAYLCSSYSIPDYGERHLGVGLIPAHAITGYDSVPSICSYILSEDSILGTAGVECKGVYLNDWQIEIARNKVQMGMKIKSDDLTLEEGFSITAQMLTTLGFLHFGSNVSFAKSIVDTAEIIAPMNS